MDGNFGLVVGCCREHLTLLARDGGVGLDELGHHATHGFNTEGKRSDVEQHDVAYAAFLIEDGTLDASTYGYHLVGVNTL